MLKLGRDNKGRGQASCHTDRLWPDDTCEKICYEAHISRKENSLERYHNLLNRS